MQAIIFADRHGRELQPLSDTYCPAMLPLLNRPVLAYTIEDLAASGINEMLVVVSDHAELIKKYFGDGEMWGVNIKYALSQGEESPDHLLSRLGSNLKAPFVAVRGDIFRSPCCEQFIADCVEADAPVEATRIGWHSAGLCMIRQWPAKLSGLAWPQQEDIKDLVEARELPVKLFSALDSLAEYHAISSRLLQSSPASIDLPGRVIDEGLRVERLSKVNLGNYGTGNILVGEKTSVQASAQLHGPSVIGHNCYLDSNVIISNSIILPGTYIGEGLQVENAIVDGNTFIRVDFNTQVSIPDPMLLSNMDRDISSMLRQLPESIIGTVLLLLSLPLWPFALFLSVLKSPRVPMRKELIVSNKFETNIKGRQHKIVTAWKFATATPLLRHLPMLWLVIKGDLRIFGSTPLSPQQMHMPHSSWDQRLEMASSGLLGPIHLQLQGEAPEEEIRLSEIDFNTSNGIFTLLFRLFSAVSLLFNARTWRPKKQSLRSV